jgi:hypothetical protein
MYTGQPAADPAQADFACSAACAIVRGFVGTEITFEPDVILALDGNGTDGLALPAPPVREVVTVTEEDATLIEGDDFLVRGGAGVLIRASGWRWPPGRGNIVVTYSRGYDVDTDAFYPGDYPGAGALPLPDDIKQVALELAKRIMTAGNAPDTSGMTGEKMGNYSYTRDAGATGGASALTPGEAAILGHYRPVGVA